MMPSIEEMEAELEQAGYRFNFKPFDEGIVNGSGFWTPPPIIAHFEPPPLAVSRQDMEKYIIETAYKHLLKEREYQAMKVLLQEVAKANYFNPLYDCRYNKAEDFEVLQWKILNQKAKALLSK